MAVDFLNADLRVLHRNMPSADRIEVGGKTASGFITRETEEPDDPGGYVKMLLVFRSDEKYPLGTTIILNGEAHKVVEVFGEETAWQHRIVRSSQK